MKAFNGILTLFNPLVEKLKLWVVLQGNTQDQRMLEGLLQLYVLITQRKIVLHVELYMKLHHLHHLLFVLNVTNQGIMPSCVIPEFSLPLACRPPIIIQGDLGVAEVEVVEAVDPNKLCMKLKPVILQNL